MSDIYAMQASKNEIKESIKMIAITQEEVNKASEMIGKFVGGYSKKDKGLTDEVWLAKELQSELPDKSAEELCGLASEIMESVKEYNLNYQDVCNVAKHGIESNKWLTNKISEVSVGLSVIDYGNYLNAIDNSITNANAQMLRTVTTNAGDISQCMNLDGFIAEQYAVNTFNMQAQLDGSPYYAEVMVPNPGETYGLNSFDTVIKDIHTGKIVHQYQFKFGKDAKTTIGLLKSGNYNNQRYVVPADQVAEIKKAFPNKSVEAYMGGTDRVPTKSGSLTKEEAKKLQLNTQEKGVLPRDDWNAFNTKELALNIGKNAGMAGLQAAVITVGFDLVTKKVKGEPIDENETVELALKAGTDSGIKAAAAGALKVASEKGVIAIIPPGTPANVIAHMVCVEIENAKILVKVASDEISMTEAVDMMTRTTTAMGYGIGWGTTGMAIGAAALSWIPIVGPIVGGIVGGTVGYMAGSKFGNAIYLGLKKLGSVIKSTANKVWSGVKKIANGVRSGFRNFKQRLFG